MSLLRKILFGLLVIQSSAAQATVVVNGLEWLELNQTAGLSYNQVTTVFSDYRVATKDEFQAMLDTYSTRDEGKFMGQVPDVFFANYNGHGYAQYTSYFTDFRTNTFRDDFGEAFFNVATGVVYSTGMYWDDDILRSGGTIVDSFSVALEFYEWQNDYTNYYYNPDSLPPVNPYDLAWYMVKSSSGSSDDENSPVPAPAPIVLLGLGLIGIGMTRRKI